MNEHTFRHRRCQTCIFWGTRAEASNDQARTCIRFPPQMVLTPMGNQHPIMYDVQQWQPIMNKDDVCGEHRSAGEGLKR